MHWSASPKRRTNWKSALVQQWVTRSLNLNKLHISGENSIVCSPLWQTHTRYDGQVAVFGSAFQEKLEKQKYFLVRAALCVCPAGGTFCTGMQELHLCFPLIVSGVNDGTCRKRLWFRWHFLQALTSWCAGTVQQCQALFLLPLTVLLLLLFTGCMCAWERERERVCMLFLFHCGKKCMECISKCK